MPYINLEDASGKIILSVDMDTCPETGDIVRIANQGNFAVQDSPRQFCMLHDGMRARWGITLSVSVIGKETI